MNDFSGLNDWMFQSKKSDLLKSYMKFPWFRKQLALIKEYDGKKFDLNTDYKRIREDGVLIEESDGQFTGGIWSETYQRNDEIYEFLFEKSEIFLMNVYDAEKYKGAL